MSQPATRLPQITPPPEARDNATLTAVADFMHETMIRTRTGEISPATANATARAAEATLQALDLSLRYADRGDGLSPAHDFYPDRSRNGTAAKKG